MIYHFRRVLDIFPLGGKIRIQYFLVFLFMIVGSWLEAIGVGIIFPLVKVIADPGTIQSMGTLRHLYDLVGTPTEAIFLRWLALAILLVFIGKNLFQVFRTNYSLRVVKNSEAALSEELLAGYQKAPWAQHVQRNSGNLLHSIVVVPSNIYSSLVWPALEGFAEVLTLVAIGALLLIADPVMTLAAAAFVGLSLTIFLQIIPARVATLGRQQVQVGKALMVTVQQALGGAKEVKVLGREKFFWNAVSVQARLRAVIERRYKLLQTIPRAVAETVLLAGMLLAIILVLSMERPEGDILAILSVFAVAAIRMMTSFSRIVAAISAIRHSLPMVDEIYNDVTACRSKDTEDNARQAEAAIIFERQISIENIYFRYPGCDTNILSGISLVIKHGQAVALVGNSGAGKTTLADIVLGLLEQESGKILVDGKNITGNMPSWQRLFGYVPQSIYLIDDTLRANIAFGLPGDQIDEQAVSEAVRLACIEDLVSRLPDGLDTVVGEGGARLSGGERQRIGIARALYHRPEVIVLDEATSALDNFTERKFTQAIDGLRGLRTVIVIAHRLSTIKRCDKIAYLDTGKIIAEGSFSDLVDRCEPFRRMAALGEDHMENG